MKKRAIATFLICASQAMAAPHLTVGDNLAVLAAKSAEVSMFSNDVALKDGEQKIVVIYDSPENPTSTNQSNGRITSKPYLLTFNAEGNKVIAIATPLAADTAEVRKQANNPTFMLTADGSNVPFTRTPLPGPTGLSTVASHWNRVVNGDVTGDIPDKISVSTQTETVKAMQKLYLQSDTQQRKAFLKWALDVQ